MVNQNRVAQGERDPNDRSQKTVIHRFDYAQRDKEGYEQGVSVELSPLFDFSIEPWALIRHVQRQMIISHLVMFYTDLAKSPAQIKLLDVGANYGELWTLLARQMKAKGAKLQYIGIDIDKDKKIIAQQLRPTIDYRIMDVLDIAHLPENPMDVIVCAETLEHLAEDKAIRMVEIMSEILSENGLVIFSVPTPESDVHRDNPFHVKLWTMDEVIELGRTFQIYPVDAFHLGIPKKNFPGALYGLEDRLPVELVRVVASAMVGDKTFGPNFVYVGRKEP